MQARRSDYLLALGIEPLVLRRVAGRGTGDGVQAAPGNVDDAPASNPAADARRDRAPAQRVDASPPSNAGADAGLFAPQPARLRLQVEGIVAFDGPHARLLRALVRAVGVVEAEVRFDASEAALPAIVLAAHGDDVLAASPADLRSARAKRAAWPQLRRLRRRLREGGA